MRMFNTSRFVSFVIRGVIPATLLAGLITVRTSAAQQEVTEMSAEPKVTICHHPPGNPENVQTISVGATAVPAHVVEHNDTIGACGSGGGDRPSSGSSRFF